MTDCQNFVGPERIRQVVGDEARKVHRVSISDLNSLFAFLNQLQGWLNTNSSVRLSGPTILALLRSYPGFINPHQLFNIPPPIILDIHSETAPLGPREADPYSGGCHARRDLHRYDPNGDEDDQPRRIYYQVRGQHRARGDGSGPRCVYPVATTVTRRAHSRNFRGWLVAAFQVLSARSVLES